MARQLVNPNFSIAENAGWCLSYARRVFGAPVVEWSAWQGWMMTEHPHEDRNFPAGVSVPVWFDWTGDVGDGNILRYGHVAVRRSDGKVWSSPLSGYGAAWFNSVDDLTRAFGNGMRYVGWSEDISDVKVIELGEPMDKITKEQEQVLAQMQTGSNPGKDYNYQFTGLTLNQANFEKMLQFWQGQPRPEVKTPEFVKISDLYIKK
jgi:hypothetical protein